MSVAPESTKPAEEVGTGWGWIGFGGIQYTIAVYDNLSILINLLLLLASLCAVLHRQEYQPLLSLQPCILLSCVEPGLWSAFSIFNS